MCVCGFRCVCVGSDVYVWVHRLGYGVATLVGSLKLHVSFAKEPYKRGYILQKRPVILRSLLIGATPYEVKWPLSSELTMKL